ncbi:DUF433 domain-containing protein [Candidatus Poriferisodalis sp.]|uniref:DUF433 domain-containing protein n=1 Tax=Candidatus Poriferisodalis sp. TaxID=3101277 RepID=UPI003B021EA4
MSEVSSWQLRTQRPLYTVAEAAQVVHVPASTMGTWVKGYRRQPRDGRPVIGEPIITSLKASSRGMPSIPFIGTAEALVVAAVRRRGVLLQRVRPALEILIQELGVEYALASRRLFTDGAEILFDYGDRFCDTEVGHAAMELVVVRNGQGVFAEVISDYLERIDYATDGFAERICVPPFEGGVIVADPKRAAGAPIFARGGARVADAKSLLDAGESARTVSEEYGMPEEHLWDFLRATSSWAA